MLLSILVSGTERHKFSLSAILRLGQEFIDRAMLSLSGAIMTNLHRAKMYYRNDKDKVD